MAIWYHIANYEDIGLNIFVPPDISDYETFMYWKNRNNDCKCISVITLESKFTSADPYFNNSSMSENDILEKNKRIIKKYDNFLEYEQNTKTREEFLPGLMNVEPIYLIDNDQWLKKLKMKGEFDRKKEKDNWLWYVKKVGVFSFDYLYQKIIVPSFNYYDFS